MAHVEVLQGPRKSMQTQGTKNTSPHWWWRCLLTGGVCSRKYKLTQHKQAPAGLALQHGAIGALTQGLALFAPCGIRRGGWRRGDEGRWGQRTQAVCACSAPKVRRHSRASSRHWKDHRVAGWIKHLMTCSFFTLLVCSRLALQN